MVPVILKAKQGRRFRSRGASWQSDVFDALTSVRPYKPAWEVERALNLLREGRGTHFDPECADAFMAQFDDVAKFRERYTDDQEYGFEPGRN